MLLSQPPWPARSAGNFNVRTVPKIGKWENVFNGGATTSGHMDKRRLQLDSGHRICLGSHLTNLLTVVLMVFMGDKVVGAEFRKSERVGMFSRAEP